MTLSASNLPPISRRAYVVRETGISMLINGSLSAGFVFLMFGGIDPVPVGGLGGAAFDFVPQTFMIALMSTLVPSVLTLRRIRYGSVARAAAPRLKLPRSVAARAVVIAVGTTVVLELVALLVLQISGAVALPFAALLPLKIFYGVVVALLVTPIAVSYALAQPA